MSRSGVERHLIDLLAPRRGHFLLESGHHGDLWLDLDALFLRPARVAPFASALARRLAASKPDAVCGPLAGGAFVAQLIAAELEADFLYSERSARPQTDELYAVEYRIPKALRGGVSRRTVAIVDDVVNAGSATRATFADLKECGARPVAVVALLVLGTAAAAFAAEERLALECLAALPNSLWAPAECPLCASGIPLEDPAG